MKALVSHGAFFELLLKVRLFPSEQVSEIKHMTSLASGRLVLETVSE